MNGMENMSGQGDHAESNRKRAYLTFVVADNEYGIDIFKVKEVLYGASPFPDSVFRVSDRVGTVNLRGRVLPVIDLHEQFGAKSREWTRLSRIIVVEIGSDAQKTAIGITADSLSGARNISADEIDPAENVHDLPGTDYVLGRVKMGLGSETLLDIDRLLSIYEPDCLGRAA